MTFWFLPAPFLWLVKHLFLLLLWSFCWCIVVGKNSVCVSCWIQGYSEGVTEVFVFSISRQWVSPGSTHLFLHERPQSSARTDTPTLVTHTQFSYWDSSSCLQWLQNFSQNGALSVLYDCWEIYRTSFQEETDESFKCIILRQLQMTETSFPSTVTCLFLLKHQLFSIWWHGVYMPDIDFDFQANSAILWRRCASLKSGLKKKSVYIIN